MPPPLFTPTDPDPDPDPVLESDPVRADLVRMPSRPGAVVTGPATSGFGTMFGDAMDKNRYYTSMYRGEGEKKALAVGDPGVGSAALGEIDTSKALGVAIPIERLRAIFGNNPAKWRSARVQLTYGDKTFSVPIIDVGPGKEPQERGVVSDLSASLWQALGLDPDQGLANVKIQVLGNAGPDYTSARAEFDQEQEGIIKALKVKPDIGAISSPAPWTSQAGLFSGMTGLTRAPVNNSPNAPEIDYEHLANWLGTLV